MLASGTRILITCEVDLSKNDAQSRHVMELAEAFREIGVPCVVVAPGVGRYGSHHSVPVKYVPTLQVHPLIRTISYQFLLAFYLVYHYFVFRPTILYNRHHITSIVPSVLAKLMRLPFVVEINGIIAEELPQLTSSRWLLQVADWVERWNYRMAHRIVAVTEGVRQAIVRRFELPEGKVVVIPNGVNTREFTPRQSLTSNGLVFGYVGSLAPWQGVETLLEAAVHVKESLPDARLLIVGGGAALAGLQAKAKSMGLDRFVQFTGPIPGHRVPEFIIQLQVCVTLKRPMASGYSPLKLYEYMACGRPIVASDVLGFEVLEQVGAGMLVPHDNPEVIAESIVQLLCDEERRHRMGEAGRNYVIDNHSWASTASTILKLIAA